jgi:polyphosphate glucokinase
MDEEPLAGGDPGGLGGRREPGMSTSGAGFPAEPAAGSVLAVDIGGSHVKALLNGANERRRFVSGSTMTPAEMVAGVLRLTEDWRFDAVAVGVPARVAAGRVVHEPFNLGGGWVGFDFAAAFGRPTRVVNDAAMQALGDYHGGRMLFLGLGTGLGSAMIVEGILAPMELAHLPFRKATYEDYVGARGLKRLGRKRWRKAILETVELFVAALEPDDVVIGGGNAERLGELPAGARLGHTEAAFLGGFRLWLDEARQGTGGAFGALPATGLGPDRRSSETGRERMRRASRTIAFMELIHTCYRITDPERSIAFYEALGLEKRRELPIRDEAVNYFLGVPGKPQPELELTYNFGVDTYELGTGYGHIAITIDNMEETLAALAEKGIDPERPPYSVREGGSLLCFVRDPDNYRIELIERSDY